MQKCALGQIWNLSELCASYALCMTSPRTQEQLLMIPIQPALPSTYRPSKDHFRALCMIIFIDDLTATRLYFQWFSPVSMCFLAHRDFSSSTLRVRSKNSLLPPFRWASPGAVKLADLPSTPTLWHAPLTELWADAMLLTRLTPSQSRREHCLQRPWRSPALSGQRKLISEVSHGTQFHPSKAYQPQRYWPLLVLLRKSLTLMLEELRTCWV